MSELHLMELARDGLALLTPVIQSVVSALIATVFLRGNTHTAEFEKLKACKFTEVIDDLIKSGKMTYLELYKCHNFLKVAKIADNIIKNSTTNTSGDYQEPHLGNNADESTQNFSSDENINVQFDFDWFMRFFDAVGNISNEDLQELWGKVLANKAKTEGVCSLRTLDILRNMNCDEAKIFQKMARFIVISNDVYFVFDEGFREDGNEICKQIIKDNDLVYQKHIRLLVDCGLMSGDSLDVATYFNDHKALYLHNYDIIAVFITKKKLKTPFVIGAYNFTSSGVELFNIIRNDSSFSQDTNYALTCLRYIQNENKNISITAHRLYNVDGDNQPQFDNANLL